MSERGLSATHLRLIDALAHKAVEDYLRLRDSANEPSGENCTNPVPLPDYERAA